MISEISFNPNLKNAVFTESIRSINLINRINEKINLKSDEIQIADFRVNVISFILSYFHF